MKLAHPEAAANRFVPYALMSALAYADDGRDQCATPGMPSAESEELEAMLATRAAKEGSWQRVREVELSDHCEDPIGFYFRVWKHITPSELEVVVAFRGTSSARDWQYGNLHWFTRLLPIKDQFDEAREHAVQIVQYFTNGPGRPQEPMKVRFVATGHSLGGGLAQAIHYAQPEIFRQVFAFNPSAVTGFIEQSRETHVWDCECDSSLGDEASIYRIYESYEVLALLRSPHKIFFGPPKYVQEVRFNFDTSLSPIQKHSMSRFAIALVGESQKLGDRREEPWYAGVGIGCTQEFRSKFSETCSLPQSKAFCP